MKPETVTITGLLVEIGDLRQLGRFTTRPIVVNDDDSPNPEKPSLVTIDVENDEDMRTVNALSPMAHVSVTFTVRGIEFTGKDGQRRRFNKLLARRVTAERKRSSASYSEPVGIPPPPSPDNEGDMPF